MPAVLVCTHADSAERDLADTLLWRQDVERRLAAKPDEARMFAVAARPAVVVVDRDLPWAARFIASLREDASTRGLSVVVMARGDFDPGEVELLEAGANAILRLPAGSEWNERLERLMSVPARKAARFPVSFQVEALANGGRPEQAQAVNLSASGILIETQAPLAIRDEVRLRFTLPKSARPIAAGGQVVRVSADARFGIEFRGLADQDSRQITGFLSTLSS
jgi:DNA-binding response OmpR family regulator